MKQMMGGFFAAFPNFEYTNEDTIAEGDKVVTRGTHEGDFMGIPATGRTVEIAVKHIARISAGKMVEHWGLIDRLSMMQQLGIIPEQG